MNTPLPEIEWPVYLILFMLILILGTTILYVRSKTRIGFNDAPADEIEEEDNSIIEALSWRNEQESNNWKL